MKPKSHEVWLSDHFNTTVFLGWRSKLFGKGRSASTFNFHFAVDNLLNAVDLVARVATPLLPKAAPFPCVQASILSYSTRGCLQRQAFVRRFNNRP
jgi:hypothetical protein